MIIIRYCRYWFDTTGISVTTVAGLRGSGFLEFEAPTVPKMELFFFIMNYLDINTERINCVDNQLTNNKLNLCLTRSWSWKVSTYMELYYYHKKTVDTPCSEYSDLLQLQNTKFSLTNKRTQKQLISYIHNYVLLTKWKSTLFSFIVAWCP